MRARVPREQPVQGTRDRREERLRHARRRADAHAVAVARDVLHRDPALLARDPRPDRPARGRQLREVQARLHPAAGGPRPRLVGREVAQAPEQVVDLVGGLRVAVLGQGLEAELEIGQRGRVQELPQLLLAQQLAEQVTVQRQRLRPPLGDRGIALVHVGRHVVEQQRARERRCPRRLDAVHGELPAPDAAKQLSQRGQVEHVGEAFPVGLHEDREGPVAARHRQQVGRPLALLPERGPGPGPAPWAGAGPARRSPGSGWQRGSTARPARRRGPRPRPDPGTAAPPPRRGSRRPPAGGSRSRRPSRSSGPRARGAPGGAPRWPSSTARAPAPRTG